MRAIVAAALLTACAKPVASRAPEAAPVVDSAFLATPYTADEIAQGCRSGTTITLRTTEADGTSASFRWTFIEGDAEGATLLTLLPQADGAWVESERARQAWEQLRLHARFPADRARRERVAVLTPFGTFPAWRYDVTGRTEDGRASETTYWFADVLAGPPMRMEVRVEGALVSTFEQVARTTP